MNEVYFILVEIKIPKKKAEGPRPPGYKKLITD